jgi:hypothetical protein
MFTFWLQQDGVTYDESNVAYLRNIYEEKNRRHYAFVGQEVKPNSLVFVGELPNGPNVHPKMDHLVCYAFWSNLALEKI